MLLGATPVVLLGAVLLGAAPLPPGPPSHAHLLTPCASLPPPAAPQLLPAVSRKPPQLKLHGHQRFWGWLMPVFKVTDEELVRSAGLDALIGVSCSLGRSSRAGLSVRSSRAAVVLFWCATPASTQHSASQHPPTLPQVRIISFGVMLFLPMTVLSLAVLLPINYTSDYYMYTATEEGVMDEYTSVFMRMTISNIRQRSPRLWWVWGGALGAAVLLLLWTD